ncbi:Auxin-responsive protein SAUR61 [Zea mays]|nr:Auxin-responsive protein SAUR61 [Zea mays]
MISTKRISQMVKKWQRMAVLGRKRLSWRVEREVEDRSCASVASKDHCMMYSLDGRRFEVPLAYLGTLVFAELLWMSYEEFGFVSHGRITLPCDAAAVEYAMCLLRKGSSADVEKAFLSTMAVSCHYASCIAIAPFVGVSHQAVICSSWLTVK